MREDEAKVLYTFPDWDGVEVCVFRFPDWATDWAYSTLQLTRRPPEITSA